MIDRETIVANCIEWQNHFEWRYVRDNYAPCSILDFGCGYGYGDIYLAMNGFAVDGYDPNSDRVRMANYLLESYREKIGNNVRFLSGFPGEKHDLVWMSHVLEHIPHEEWSDIFSMFTGTPMLISVPLGNAYDHPEHVHHWYSSDALADDLQKYTGLTWKVWEDGENLVIKATHDR
jgi:SAM-dependent methyltransferase